MDMNVGDEQIYRLRDDAPSEHVRIVGSDRRKKKPRYEIEFLDGEKKGTQENVPANRLRGPWAGVREYDELMENWRRIERAKLTDSEGPAATTVFQVLIPGDVADWDWAPVRYATRIYARDALETIIGLPIDDILSQIEWFELDDELILSPEGTLMVAEYACRVAPMKILDWVVEDELRYREKAKRGGSMVGLGKEPTRTSPEWEYRWYLEYGRPLHELLRAWCGHRAATIQERLGAAEAEVQRLNELIARLIDELTAADRSFVADRFARLHDEERITAANYRPVVDRPLKPSEIPVRYVRAPRRWGY